MRQRFGGRVQKLAIDAGLSCPNRDGSIGYGGCTFCLNEAFSPSYCRTQPSITEQIEAAIKFHTSRGRTADRYIAYFQAGTNTHAPLLKLKDIYSEALSPPYIGTHHRHTPRLHQFRNTRLFGGIVTRQIHSHRIRHRVHLRHYASACESWSQLRNCP